MRLIIFNNGNQLSTKISFILIVILVTLFVGKSHAQTQGISLNQQWEIGEKEKHSSLFEIIRHRPRYVIVANYTSAINILPTSTNPRNTAIDPLDYDQVEVKYQFSFKTKVLSNLFGSPKLGSLWVAYTQTSNWQLYTKNLSRPFRETNYQPELLWIIPTEFSVFGIKGVYTGIGIVHQSNGKQIPLSRTWDRLIVQLGLKVGNTNVIVSSWLRRHEEEEIDDNPGIENYLGSAELQLDRKVGRSLISLTARHTMDNHNRGSIRFSYSFILRESLNIRTQFFHGYGESLIDFNFKQTTFGVGLSF